MTKFVPYLAEEAIERDAEALLAEFADARDVVIEPPIPIEDIIEKYLKLGFEFADTHSVFGIPRNGMNLREGPDILGAMFFDERRIVIDESLDPDENPPIEGRYRFTLAHEGCGHWRLHRHLFANDPAQTSLFGGQSVPSVVCRSNQSKERVEWQADFHASCVLMPRKLVFKTWYERFGSYDPFIYELHKNGPIAAQYRSTWVHVATALGRALVGPDEAEYEIAFRNISREFASVFNVSTIAMCIRLEKLGLLLRDVPHQRVFAGG